MQSYGIRLSACEDTKLGMLNKLNKVEDHPFLKKKNQGVTSIHILLSRLMWNSLTLWENAAQLLPLAEK